MMMNRKSPGISVFAQRRIGALQIYLSVCYQIFHYLSQIETHPRLYAETNVNGYAVEGVGNQSLAVVLQRIRCVNKLHVDKPGNGLHVSAAC